MGKVTRRTFLGTGATVLAAGVTADTLAQEPAEPQAAKPTHLQAGENTHENIIFACSGGLSNAAMVTWLAAFEVVKELGLQKVAVGCLAALSTGLPKMLAMAQAARKVIVVDGCPKACARRTVEAAGLKSAAEIVVTRDVPMNKEVFREDLGGELKSVTDYLADSDVKKAKQLIVNAISASP